MKAKVQITQELFSCVKIMSQSGATIEEITKYFGISAATISRIRASETLAEYKQMIAAMHAEQKKQKQVEKAVKTAQMAPQQPEKKPEEPPTQIIEHRQTISMVANHYMMEELKTQTEYLKLIKNVITAIAEELGCFKEKGEK